MIGGLAAYCAGYQTALILSWARAAGWPVIMLDGCAAWLQGYEDAVADQQPPVAVARLEPECRARG